MDGGGVSEDMRTFFEGDVDIIVRGFICVGTSNLPNDMH